MEVGITVEIPPGLGNGHLFRKKLNARDIGIPENPAQVHGRSPASRTEIQYPFSGQILRTKIPENVVFYLGIYGTGAFFADDFIANPPQGLGFHDFSYQFNGISRLAFAGFDKDGFIIEMDTDAPSAARQRPEGEPAFR